MKLLWVNSNFMHPTNKGGSIRTLEMLRHLHRRHEIHYAAIAQPGAPEGPARASEYSTKSYPVEERIPSRGSVAFGVQVLRGFVGELPVNMERFRSPRLGQVLADLMRREKFDRVVCDHLTPASYFPHLDEAFLFQHNVETIIWRRHVQHAADPLRRAYFAMQARTMFRVEPRGCRPVRPTLAVSAVDARTGRERSFHGRIHFESALDGFFRKQTGGEHHARVRRVRATCNRRDNN